jgi:hypothetical protein
MEFSFLVGRGEVGSGERRIEGGDWVKYVV